MVDSDEKSPSSSDDDGEDADDDKVVPAPKTSASKRAAKEKSASVDEKSAPAPTPTEHGPIGTATWGLVLYLGCRLIEIFLAAQSMAGAVGQAVLVEWGSSRVGVVWSDPKEPMTGGVIARRIGIGAAAIGLPAAGIVFLTLVVSRSAQVVSVVNIEASVLAIGFITAALSAWRDELLHHGIVLRALEQTSVSSVWRVLACGATSAGAALGRSDMSARGVFVATALGIVFGAVWVRDRGAWQPWAAHTAFTYATGTLFAGGVVHLKLADNAWAGGNAGMLGGTAAAITVGPLAVLALVLTARMPARRGAQRVSPTNGASVG